MSDKLAVNKVVPLVAGAVVAGVVIGRYLIPAPPRVNVNAIDSADKKVVHAVDVEDIGDNSKKAMCRCWRSKDFPYCDGSHNAHNEATGDNVGPLLIKHKD